MASSRSEFTLCNQTVAYVKCNQTVSQGKLKKCVPQVEVRYPQVASASRRSNLEYRSSLLEYRSREFKFRSSIIDVYGPNLTSDRSNIVTRWRNKATRSSDRETGTGRFEQILLHFLKFQTLNLRVLRRDCSVERFYVFLDEFLAFEDAVGVVVEAGVAGGH